MLVLLVVIINSCSPTINYLGDVYAPSDSIDTYYSPNDIDVEFKVMGQIQNELDYGSTSLRRVQDKMIEEAMKVGADGILFLNFETVGVTHFVAADLLRYDR